MDVTCDEKKVKRQNTLFVDQKVVSLMLFIHVSWVKKLAPHVKNVRDYFESGMRLKFKMLWKKVRGLF